MDIPFGIDPALVGKIDWKLALSRVVHDLRTDFIHAPHLGFIYGKAGDELVALLKSELTSGKFSPGLPLTIEVPKSLRLRVSVPSKRLGPNFSRPGSILPPKDRLLYQALADQAAPIIASKTDANRSFSHRVATPPGPSMFVASRICWNELHKAIAAHAAKAAYVLKIDVANFFGSLNQHTLVNVLNDAAYPNALRKPLETMLTSYAGERGSRGILQGMYPSDLLGNFYLSPIDRFLEEYGVLSARYVDDIYIFLESVDKADQLLRELIPALRSYDLVLSEAKSKIMTKAALNAEEPDLEALFEAASNEISHQLKLESFFAEYGFQTEWSDKVADEQDLELHATIQLFDSMSEYPGEEEQIERFCLPIFSRAASPYAVDHVLGSFKLRPSMSQIYAWYLSKFLDQKEVLTFLVNLLEEHALSDWQKMWVLAAISQTDTCNDDAVKGAWQLLKDANRHLALRAASAIYVGRFGDLARRKALSALYPSVPEYLQLAILYSARTWPAVERANAKATWGGHGPNHALLVAAMGNKDP